MSYLRTNVVSHAFKVKSLYKRALRELQSYYQYRHLYRYHAVLLRARFDEHKYEPDVLKAKRLLEEGEAELQKYHHPQPIIFANSPGGVAYGREVTAPDWVLDMWHPLEKAQYPEYFKRRDQRKLEFIENWENKYGKAEPEAH